MARKCIVITISLQSKEQLDLFKAYAKKRGFSSVSRMIQSLVLLDIQREKHPIDKTLEPLAQKIDGLYKIMEGINDLLEIVKIKLAKQDENSEVRKVAREILNLVLKRDMGISDINGKLHIYSRDVIDSALSLLYDLGLLKINRSNGKSKIMGDEKK